VIDKNDSVIDIKAPPSVSVCILADREAAYLTDAIDSVLEQICTDFELIVVVNAEPEPASKIAQAYAERDSRVQIVRIDGSKGLAETWNACLALACGRYVKLLSANNYFYSPTALSCLVALCDSNPAISLAASAAQNNPYPCDSKRIKWLPSPTERSEGIQGDRVPVERVEGVRAHFSCDLSLSGTATINRCLLEQTNLLGSLNAVMFRRNCAARGFDVRYTQAADLEMWFHLLEQGCFAYIDTPLIASRQNQNPPAEDTQILLEQSTDWRLLLEEYLDKPYIRLSSSTKERLVHESVRQSLLICQRNGLKQDAAALLKDYGESKYWKQSPINGVWRGCRELLRPLEERSLPPVPTCRLGKLSLTRPLGFNVAGFLKGEYGIGESSRAFCRAIEETGLPASYLNIEAKDHRNADGSVTALSRENPYSINLMTFSFDYSRRFYRDKGPRFFEDRYNIALWYWEQERFPARLHCNYDYYDEIWVPTQFCQEAIAAASPVPVKRITYPLPFKTQAPADRPGFSLPETAAIFLFTFDYFSTTARKNPAGVIKAFQQAFRKDEEVLLVIKSINGAARNEDRALLHQTATDPRIRFLESHLTGAQMNTLIASCDCYVSLHRSEGLGLGMAQAMALAKPVIATGYSGNLEYMNAENSLLVDFKLITLEEDYGVYEKGSRWAEPDIEHAAELMRWVHLHKEESIRLGAIARQSVRATLNPDKTTREILERVREIERMVAD
jgi:glycosyltransferase involved in cell wall biosynthesis